MKDKKNYYTILAELFRYPEKDFFSQVKKCQDFLDKNYPVAGKLLQPFSSYIDLCSLDEMQELFTKTFDVQPICYLDLGYVMFGEDYKRGAFLLNMQEEQRKINNDCGSDLSDNICNILVLMTKSKDDVFVEDLVLNIFNPCLKKMIAEFDSARIDMKMKILRKMHRAVIQEDLNRGNVYKSCFSALSEVLKENFGEKEIITEDNTVLQTPHHKSFFNKKTAVQNINTNQNKEAKEFAYLNKLD